MNKNHTEVSELSLRTNLSRSLLYALSLTLTTGHCPTTTTNDKLLLRNWNTVPVVTCLEGDTSHTSVQSSLWVFVSTCVTHGCSLMYRCTKARALRSNVMQCDRCFIMESSGKWSCCRVVRKYFWSGRAIVGKIACDASSGPIAPPAFFDGSNALRRAMWPHTLFFTSNLSQTSASKVA